MFFYYAFVVLLLLAVGPLLLLPNKRRTGIWQKLGLVPESIKQRFVGGPRPVWFHAVSVGEFNAIWPLIEAFAKKRPEHPILITTGTATGQKLAQERAKHLASIAYFPLDLPWAIAAWLDVVNPRLVVIVETEMWPGFTFECQRRKIPIVVANGRISLRSFKRYRLLKPFFAPVFRRCTAILAQSDTEANRYRDIAGGELNVVALGNLKCDGLNPISHAEQESIKEKLCIRADERILIGGSTHEGEETALLDAFLQLRQSGQERLRLVLAPRHPERWNHVADLISAYGLQVRRYSAGESFVHDTDVYLLDTIGQLFGFYSVATIAFVGGSLAPIGGHNLLEPFAYGVPVICGPHLFKTQDTAYALREREALKIIHNADELKEALLELLKSSPDRQRIGRAGNALLLEGQGAVERTLQFLCPLLSGEPTHGPAQEAEATLAPSGMVKK